MMLGEEKQTKKEYLWHASIDMKHYATQSVGEKTQEMKGNGEGGITKGVGQTFGMMFIVSLW